MAWIGYWIAATAALHTALGLHLHGDALTRFADAGVFGAASTDADDVAIWFLAAGLVMFALGVALTEMPKKRLLAGAALGVVALCGAALIPLSGFWLLIPPAAGLVWADL